jgi:quercetin dioxygenase-like cupin family protein
MKLDQLYAGDHCKVLKAAIPAGGKMPRHHATSDAFVIVIKGTATLVFDDGESTLKAGTTFLIPGREPHVLEVSEDFEAYIIIGPDAGIEMEKGTTGQNP